MIVWWFLGATCAGKKTLIRRLLWDPSERAKFGMNDSVRAVWMEDGDELPPPFEGADHVLVRWQWGRTEHLRAMLRTDRRHRIVLVEAPVEVRLQRVIEREGFERWGREVLAGEAKESARLAERICRRANINLVRVEMP